MAYSGKLAVITGGGSGMGQLAARSFAAGGATVCLIDVNEQGMQTTAEGLSNVQAFSCDITDPERVDQVIGEIESRYSEIDRLYNCAAIMPFGRLLEQDISAQRKLIEVNVLGLMNVTRRALPAMVERGRGDYVSFASTAGIIPCMLMGAYAASKAAVAMYNEVLYHENRDTGVRFVSVCPPPVNTPLLQQGRDTDWPKIMETGETIEPSEVIEEVERCLEKGQFLCLPGKQTRMGHLMRRLLPGFVWSQVHKVEGF